MIQKNETKTDESSSGSPLPGIDLAIPDALQTATFALGWFWGPEAQFGSIKGIYRTRVGYTGGTTVDPTYQNMGDHTEAMQVDFDPQQIGYEDVATLFWKTHNPCAAPSSRQYMSAIWYHDQQQRDFVQGLLAAANDRFDGGVTTPVEPLRVFYLAEDYHQKYRLQSKQGLMSVFQTMYPAFEDFNNSTAAARLNAFAAGNGSKRLFEEEVNQYGFPRAELESVLRI